MLIENIVAVTDMLLTTKQKSNTHDAKKKKYLCDVKLYEHGVKTFTCEGLNTKKTAKWNS